MTNDDAYHLERDVPTKRQFGWSNLLVAPDEDPRSDSPSVGERATLIDFITGCCVGASVQSRWLGVPFRHRTCRF
jgi:hypothetical protein